MKDQGKTGIQQCKIATHLILGINYGELAAGVFQLKFTAITLNVKTFLGYYAFQLHSDNHTLNLAVMAKDIVARVQALMKTYEEEEIIEPLLPEIQWRTEKCIWRVFLLLGLSTLFWQSLGFFVICIVPTFLLFAFVFFFIALNVRAWVSNLSQQLEMDLFET
ncbi:MAG: hypothetical protein ACFFB3_09875 [Candidatus Hodarchaeota archaeon]